MHLARLLSHAIEIAARAHSGVLDRSSEPYILHPLRVMSRVSQDHVLAIIGVLHDVVEDCNITLDDLRREGFPEEVIEGIDAVTRREGETYMDFIHRCAKCPRGVIIKMCDIYDNTSKTRMDKLPPEDAADLCVKYRKAQVILQKPYIEACHALLGGLL